MDKKAREANCIDEAGLVSVIMPMYNCVEYVEDSIKSVLGQTYTNWELLIVDDVSTDGSRQIVESYAASDSRIRLLQNEKNSGAAVSRNYALREARGKWIAFLDSDDQWVPEKLSKQLVFMIENGYSFTCTDYRIQLNGVWQPYINIGPKVIGRRKMYNYCYISTITVMYDRDVIGLIQIPDIKKANDYAMWLRIVEKSKCYRLPECLSYYIKHDGSISSGSKIRLIKRNYLLFRDGMGKNVPMSLLLTANNLFFGVLKKLFYKKKIR